MTNLFFTSDTHFGHKNIIEYSKRPFKDVEEMDEMLIKKWNDKVKPQDQIWHLGDFTFHPASKVENILRRLNGHKHYIWGNHDQTFEKNTYLLNYFDSVQNYKELRFNGHKLILFHYPIFSWNGAHKGSWHIHGHCHNSVNWANVDTTRIDAGVDNFNYEPASYEEIADILSKKTYKVVDHHDSTR